jgi:hypothetical protein
VARSPQDWQDAIESFWNDPARRVQAGLDTRAWVIAEHTWMAVARKALEGLRKSTSEGAGA